MFPSFPMESTPLLSTMNYYFEFIKGIKKVNCKGFFRFSSVSRAKEQRGTILFKGKFHTDIRKLTVS